MVWGHPAPVHPGWVHWGASILERYAPLFTSMFLHGGFMHLFGNMLYLWIFGNTLEDRLGHGRFGLLYVLCGLGADLTQIALDPSSRMPIIGASGAVAGVLGASVAASSCPHRGAGPHHVLLAGGGGASHVLPARLVSDAGAERSRLAHRDACHGGRGAYRWIRERDGLGVLLSTWKRVW